VHSWHLANGWSDIGDHYLIRMDGSVERGRPEDAVGAHAKRHNDDSIGVCLAGNIDLKPPTVAQMVKLVEIIWDIRSRYGELSLLKHSDVGSTACPGRLFSWDWLVRQSGALPQPQARVGVVLNGEMLPQYGYLIDSTSYVPVRSVAEHLGALVQWQGEVVYIMKEE